MTYIQSSGNKYQAKRTDYEGQVYHSKLEAAYAQELDLRIKAKDIVSWERQVRLDLKVNGQHIANYYIDFVVRYPDSHRDFVECKGLELGEWRLKWRLLEATFDDFKEHPDDQLVLVKQSSMGFFRR